MWDQAEIGVEKSPSHHLSQTEIASDNPCSQHVSGNALPSDYVVNLDFSPLVGGNAVLYSLAGRVIPLTVHVECPLVLGAELGRLQGYRYLVEFAGESKWHLIVFVIHGRACVHADIKRFVPLKS